MQVLEVPLPAVARGERVSVGHVAARCHRGLDFGEEILVRSGDGEHHLATVERIEFEVDDTVYLLSVGTRLPAEMVAERLSGALADPEVAERHRLVRLLAELDPFQD